MVLSRNRVFFISTKFSIHILYTLRDSTTKKKTGNIESSLSTLRQDNSQGNNDFSIHSNLYLVFPTLRTRVRTELKWVEFWRSDSIILFHFSYSSYSLTFSLFFFWFVFLFFPLLSSCIFLYFKWSFLYAFSKCNTYIKMGVLY